MGRWGEEEMGRRGDGEKRRKGYIGSRFQLLFGIINAEHGTVKNKP